MFDDRISIARARRTVRGGGCAFFVVLMCSAVCLAMDTQTKSADQPAGAEGQDKRAKELSKRLLGGESANQDIMTEILRRMQKVEHRLGDSFDAGDATRKMQQRIIDDLNQAIAAAVRRGSGGGSGDDAAEGDQRKRATRRNQPAGQASDGDSASANTPARRGKPATPDERDASTLRESLRGWGHLPARDREEVIQGISERSLEKFRRWIDRYYKTLAEAESK